VLVAASLSCFKRAKANRVSATLSRTSGPITSREWGIYPFVPPAFSLLVGWFVVPVYNSWFDRRLAERLRNVPLFTGSPRRLFEKREQIRDIVLGSGLQLLYLTAFPTLIVTWLAVASQQEHSFVAVEEGALAGVKKRPKSRAGS
jgi:hypothetical protein